VVHIGKIWNIPGYIKNTPFKTTMQSVLRVLGDELGFAKLEYIWGIDFYSYPLMPSMGLLAIRTSIH
jgi:hypothetical protein